MQLQKPALIVDHNDAKWWMIYYKKNKVKLLNMFWFKKNYQTVVMKDKKPMLIRLS